MVEEITHQNGNNIDKATSEDNTEREAVVNKNNQETNEEINNEVDKVSEARQVIKEMREANAERLKLIEREERLMANQMISGKGRIGNAPREETAREYADKILKGK